MSNTLPKRSEVDPATTWNAASIFATDNDWEAAVLAVQAGVLSLSEHQVSLAEGPANLAAALMDRDELLRKAGKVFIYAQLHWSVDTVNPSAGAMSARARALLADVQAAAAFVEPGILALGPDTIAEWQIQEPALAIYAHYFETLFRMAAHIRSAEVEEILGMAVDPFRAAAMSHSILADADMTFEPAQPTDATEPSRIVAQGTIGALITDRDRELRRTAFENYADSFLAHKHSLANMLAAGVKQDVFVAKARRYPSSLAASLGRNFIPVEVFHNTINTFKEYLPVWHRYLRLRKRALGYDSLQVYDIKAPLVEARPEISYRQAVEWIAAGMAPLGDEYVDILVRGATEQRWVDVYPNVGKRSGAFSTGVPGTNPYIMMSFTDDVFSLSTLAHELGHSLHSYFAWQNQPLVYSRYSLFVAEVASNFNQALVRDHLLRTQPERDFQIAILEEALSNYHRYFFIMPTLARFELEIHERIERGEALTAQSLIALMADLFREGYGNEVDFDEERVGITWAQFPNHLYSNFYVYQYTTGIAAANALAAKLLAGEEGMVDSYLNFLKCGNAVYPIDALKATGVDMTSPEPVSRAFEVLAGYVSRLEELLEG